MSKKPGAARPVLKPLKPLEVASLKAELSASPEEEGKQFLEAITKALLEFPPHVQNQIIDGLLSNVMKARHASYLNVREQSDYLAKNNDELVSLNGTKIFQNALDNLNTKQNGR